MTTTRTGAPLPGVSETAAIDLRGVHKHFGKVVIFSVGAVWRFRKDTARV